MQIAIIGAGVVGQSLAEQLSQEGHRVSVVDRDRAKVRALAEKLDVLAVYGNAGMPSVLHRAGVHELFGPHVLGREAQLLGVHEQHSGVGAGRDHPVGLGHGGAQGFLADDVLARLGRVATGLAVQVVGQRQHHHVHLVQLQQ